MKYVIIGNSAAAVGAVEGIRMRDQESSITIIAQEPHHTYARPLISYLLSGKVSKERLAYRPDNFYTVNKVMPMLGIKVTRVDSDHKRIYLDDGKQVDYDRLLIATGSRSSEVKIAGMDLQNVFPFYTLTDAQLLQKYLRPHMQAVVLGAGLTALKAAEALVAKKIKTTVVVRSRILRTFLDPAAADMLVAHLRNAGVTLAVGQEVKEVMGKEAAEAVMLADGSTLPCDFVVSAMGIVANKEIVSATSMQVDHGILVDEQLRTSVADVFAAGDVAQGYDCVTGQRRVIPILPVAYAQGEVAGRNMAGDHAAYRGMGMNAVSFLGLPIISAGLLHGEDGDEIHVVEEKASGCYRKLVFRDQRLRGYILVNQVDRAGILTWLIRENVDVSSFKASLIDGTFSYAHLPINVRQRQLS
ncbi:MAG: FAD-dependent oxidoreductase [Firmicutes bacterium]|nr:FAD-dependent oxidoreductase [Bacillota bacterium]